MVLNHEWVTLGLNQIWVHTRKIIFTLCRESGAVFRAGHCQALPGPATSVWGLQFHLFVPAKKSGGPEGLGYWLVFPMEGWGDGRFPRTLVFSFGAGIRERRLVPHAVTLHQLGGLPCGGSCPHTLWAEPSRESGSLASKGHRPLCWEPWGTERFRLLKHPKFQ